MKNLARKVKQVTQTGCSALLITGNEVAPGCFILTVRSQYHPVVVVNCGAMPVDVVERELYGREGAFTGVHALK